MRTGNFPRLSALKASVLVCCLASLAQSQISSSASSLSRADAPLQTIQGKVVNSLTGDPIRRALVSFYTDTQRAVLTDDEGRFVFERVRPWPMSLQVRKPGFFAAHNGRTIVDPSKLIGPLELRLTPAAVIYGQITGADDEPLQYVPVQLFRSTVSNGRRRWQSTGMRSTDEDGRFRIPDLQPGSYKIGAGPLLNRNLNPADAGYSRIFYSNALDRSSATTIDLAPAQQQEINLSMRPVRVYKVTGTVLGAQKNMSIGIQFHDGSDELIAGIMARFDAATGAFEARLPAGGYAVGATSHDDQGHMLFARVPIQVEKDMSGIVLSLQPTITIPVNVRTEFVRSTRMGPETATPLSASVQLNSITGAHGSVSSTPDKAPGSASIVIANAEPGSYDVRVSAQGAWQSYMYIASASCGSTNVLSDPLTVPTNGQIDPIEIVVRDDGATLEGLVRDAKDSGAVLIVSDADRKRTSIGRYGTNGHLFAPALAPGAYTLYAFDRLDDIEFSNPEILRQFESRAGHVSLSANQTSRVTLDLIETDK